MLLKYIQIFKGMVRLFYKLTSTYINIHHDKHIHDFKSQIQTLQSPLPPTDVMTSAPFLDHHILSAGHCGDTT